MHRAAPGQSHVSQVLSLLIRSSAEACNCYRHGSRFHHRSSCWLRVCGICEQAHRGLTDAVILRMMRILCSSREFDRRCITLAERLPSFRRARGWLGGVGGGGGSSQFWHSDVEVRSVSVERVLGSQERIFAVYRRDLWGEKPQVIILRITLKDWWEEKSILERCFKTLLHLQYLIDGRDFRLSHLVVLLKWGVSRLTEGPTKERRRRRHQLKKRGEVGARVHGKLTHQGREKHQKILDSNTLAVTCIADFSTRQKFHHWALCSLWGLKNVMLMISSPD